MNVDDLRYLMELVRRDGDDRLQADYGIRRIKLYEKLARIVSDCETHTNSVWNVPIMPVLRIDTL